MATFSASSQETGSATDALIAAIRPAAASLLREPRAVHLHEIADADAHDHEHGAEYQDNRDPVVPDMRGEDRQHASDRRCPDQLPAYSWPKARMAVANQCES